MGLVVGFGLAALALFGAPLFSIFGASSMALFHHAGLDMNSVAADVFGEKFGRSPTLVTIPLFTFSGYLMAESGTPKRLVDVSRALFGWLPGGLAMVCILASAFFTTFSGASGITIVAVGGLLLPALLADGYDQKFSLGLVTTCGSLGLLFPPSLAILLYGIIAGLDINQLFLAGLLPGVVSVLVLVLYGGARGWRLPRSPFRAKAAVSALWVAKWEVVLPVALIGGLYSRLLRIHEAAAFMAAYVLIVEVFIYRDVGLKKDLPRIVRDSMMLVGAILLILSAAIGLTNYLLLEQVADKMFEAIRPIVQSRIAFLMALNVFLLIVGMLMDVFSAIIAVVPLIAPLAAQYNVHPLHLAVIFLLNLEIGYLTPPVGLNLYISSFRFRRPVVEVVRASAPFLLILLVALFVVTYWEGLSLWLASFYVPR